MIILIEDNKQFARVMRILLGPSQVVVVPDIATADSLVAAAGPQDTVLVDLHLPDSEPLDTLCRIAKWKSSSAGTRFIVITGTRTPGVIEEARKKADAVILKSNPDGFFDALRGLGLLPGCKNPPCACSTPLAVQRIEEEVREMLHA